MISKLSFPKLFFYISFVVICPFLFGCGKEKTPEISAAEKMQEAVRLVEDISKIDGRMASDIILYGETGTELKDKFVPMAEHFATKKEILKHSFDELHSVSSENQSTIVAVDIDDPDEKLVIHKGLNNTHLHFYTVQKVRDNNMRIETDMIFPALDPNFDLVCSPSPKNYHVNRSLGKNGMFAWNEKDRNERFEKLCQVPAAFFPAFDTVLYRIRVIPFTELSKDEFHSIDGVSAKVYGYDRYHKFIVISSGSSAVKMLFSAEDKGTKTVARFMGYVRDGYSLDSYSSPNLNTIVARVNLIEGQVSQRIDGFGKPDALMNELFSLDYENQTKPPRVERHTRMIGKIFVTDTEIYPEKSLPKRHQNG